jgi:alkaline phosphatase D
VSTDTWDGYRPARERLFDTVERSQARNVVVLTGDVHSSWAYDVPRNPWAGYKAETGAGTLAVEFVTPSITSPSGFGTPEQAAQRVSTLRGARPHLKYVDGLYRGYVVLDVTRERVQADWFGVSTVTERSHTEQFMNGLLTVAGDPRLQQASGPVSTSGSSPAPAPPRE